MPIRLHALLSRYLQRSRPRLGGGSPQEALFLANKGGPLSHELLYMMLRKRAQSAGIESKVFPRVLRHSWARVQLCRGEKLARMAVVGDTST